MSSRSKTLMSLMLLALVAVLMSPAAYAQTTVGNGDGENTCVFVFGTIEGRVVTTPAIPIVVPPTTVVLGPTRVHVDPATQTIQGFTLTTPGADQTVNGTTLFVPGVNKTVPSFSATIDDLSVSNKTCLNFGVTTPAIPIDIDTIILQTPGAEVNTPETTINPLGVHQTVDGQTITLYGQTIVIPGKHVVVPSRTIDTPDKTI